jgi:hypothetical protein
MVVGHNLAPYWGRQFTSYNEGAAHALCGRITAKQSCARAVYHDAIYIVKAVETCASCRVLLLVKKALFDTLTESALSRGPGVGFQELPETSGKCSPVLQNQPFHEENRDQFGCQRHQL